MKAKHKHYAVLTASTLGLVGFSFASGLGDEKYTYDASGNIIKKRIGEQVTHYDYTGIQLNGTESASGSKQYAYDSSGRLTSDSEAGKPTRNMEYQYLDKVTKVQSDDKTTELFYNAEGQLVATNSAGTSETYVWDGLALVNRGDELYVNEKHSVGGVPAIVGNQVAVADMVGTSLSVGDESFESTAFGEGFESGLFTGKPFVAELGCFLFKHRNYSAIDARWISPDPSGFPDGTNNLEYAGGNPTTTVDPNGLENLPISGWTQKMDGGGGGPYTLYDFTYYFNPSDTSKEPLHRLHDDNDPDSVFLQRQGCSTTIGPGGSASWNTSSAVSLNTGVAITLWEVLDLDFGAGGTAEHSSAKSYSFHQPYGGSQHMVRPTREEITYTITKRTYGEATTTWNFWTGISRTYTAVSPPVNTPGGTLKGYTGATSYDVYEK